MSQYIKAIEKDYNDGIISIIEITKLRKDYDELSYNDKEKLDTQYGKVKADSKTSKPLPKISNEEKVINLLTEQNSKLSTIKGILQFFFVLTVLSIIFYVFLVGSLANSF